MASSMNWLALWNSHLVGAEPSREAFLTLSMRSTVGVPAVIGSISIVLKA